MSKIVRTRPSESFASQPVVGSANTADFIGYYKPTPGLKSITPSGKSPFKGRILPCYDLSLDTVDAAFKTGVSPYRIEGWVDSTSGSFEFSEFCVSMPCYTYLGRSQNRIISPQARTKWYSQPPAEDVADPFVDMLNLIQGSGNPEWLRITTRPSENEAALLNPIHVRSFFNMWGVRAGDREPYNCVVDASVGAYYDLKYQLNHPATEQAPGRDPNWPQYLLGDVTDVTHGLVAVAGLITNIAGRKKFNGFTFQLNNGERNTLQGVQERAVTAEILAGRCLLLSDESVFKILSYQELVDFAINDGAFPLELIKRACGHMANVTGKDHSKPVHVVPPPAQRIPAIAPAALDTLPPLPPVPTALAAPVPPPPAPPKPEEPKFYYISEHNATTPVMDTVSSIQAKLDANMHVQVHHNGSWLSGNSLEVLGFIVAPPPLPVAVPPPPPPVASTVTAEYIPPVPAVPVVEAPVVVASTAKPDATPAAVTEEELAWYRDITPKLLHQSMSPEDMFRWAELDAKIKGAH